MGYENEKKEGTGVSLCALFFYHGCGCYMLFYIITDEDVRRQRDDEEDDRQHLRDRYGGVGKEEGVGADAFDPRPAETVAAQI